jgi:DNA-binding SARP family transcriptional activator/pimeloyl-ACP methyl ester carboxylesterase
MQVSVLGPLRVDGTRGTVALGAAKERSLLTALALSPGSVVAAESLIAALWGEDPPASARKTLQTYVWNLRQALGHEAIATEPPGYVLRIRPDDVDVHRFRALVREGEEAMRQGDASSASEKLGAAVALRRGEPLAGVAPHTGLAAEGVRLREELLSGLEARVAADLADGRHAALVGELEALVREHPFRERLWGYLMIALYRCGRQADALDAYQRARRVLTSELGLEPGGDLRRIEAAVLTHDPAIAEPGRPATVPTSGIVRSPVRFARTDDGAHVAYQVAGDGPVDILAVAGFVSHLDIWWNAPTDRLVRRLTSMGRLISFDKRGMGLSDRPDHVDAEQWVEDTRAVLDAVGSERAVVLGVSSGAPTALRFAARYPERVQALVLHGGYARALAGDDYAVGWDRDIVESFAEQLEAGWGSGVLLEFFAPSRANDPDVRGYWARYQLLSASPAAAMRFFWATVEDDVRDVLPTLAVPTLVVHPERDVIVPLAQAQHMALRIPDAELVVLDSDVHLICICDVLDELADAIESFLGRVVPGQVRADEAPELVLVTAVAVRGVPPGARADAEAIVAGAGGRLQAPGLTATFEAPSRAVACARSVLDKVGGDVAIGVHTAECTRNGKAYRGPAVDGAAELARQASPGEVVVSDAVRALVGAA